MTTQKDSFKARARLLLELGDQLIKDESIAVFELVKNGYDADANKVLVELYEIDSPKKGRIEITDDGQGMDLDTIRNVWLEPGTNFREKQLISGTRTPRYKRMPLGQKGIGRFGAHKLGKTIQLITRKEGNDEIIIDLDWSIFTADKYLDEIPVNISTRKPELFKGNSSGTKIIIKQLWSKWTRGLVRKIHRNISSICSPYKSPDSFKTELILYDKDKTDWLEGLWDWKDVVKFKLFNATCFLEGNKLSYDYNFEPWKTMNLVDKRRVSQKNIVMGFDTKDDSVEINLSKYNIGKVRIDLYIYDLDSNVLSLGVEKEKKGLKEFLKFNGGIRVYRDNIRVYDYGAPGNDWLELGTRRVNLPTLRISNNIVLGAVSIERISSSDLMEKTNREGFIENEAYEMFKLAIIYSLSQIETERFKDKTRIRNAYQKNISKEPVLQPISDLRKKIKKKGLEEELGSYLDQVERDYSDIKNRLLTSASAGLNLSVVIHEVEKVLKELELSLSKSSSIQKSKQLAKRLTELIGGYSNLIRGEGLKTISSKELIEQALFNVEYRLDAHKIKIIMDLDDTFKLKCTKRLILNSIMNLIDNSIWWLENKNPEQKIIYIKTTELEDGYSIIIADNGPGLIDSLEYLVEPFITRKPDGMGLGLHIVSEVMKSHKGIVRIIEKGEVSLPKEITGACLALIFNRDEK